MRYVWFNLGLFAITMIIVFAEVLVLNPPTRTFGAYCKLRFFPSGLASFGSRFIGRYHVLWPIDMAILPFAVRPFTKTTHFKL